MQNLEAYTPWDLITGGVPAALLFISILPFKISFLIYYINSCYSNRDSFDIRPVSEFIAVINLLPYALKYIR